MKENIELTVNTTCQVMFSPDIHDEYCANITPHTGTMSFDFVGIRPKDILAQIEPDYVVAFFDAEELLDKLGMNLIVNYLEEHGYKIEKHGQ